jgi:glucan biosynthesis protein C
MTSWLLPFVLAAAIAPLVVWAHEGLSLARYGLFFALGWWLRGHRELLMIFAKRWLVLVALGLVAAVMVRFDLVLVWDAAYVRALVTTASVFGWVGFFVRYLDHPSEQVRYIADASYWIYIMHAPLLVAMQIWWADWALPWWVEIPLINVFTLSVLVLIYGWAVRPTWIGAWLNGRRYPASAVAATAGTR